MTRTIIVGEVTTGRRITQIPVAGASWSTSLRDGEITVDVPLLAEEFKRYSRRFVDGLYPGAGVWPSESTWPQEAKPIWSPSEGLRPTMLAALEPVRCFLAVVESQDSRSAEVIEAGPIWSWDWDDANGRLRVTAKSMWSLFDKRLALDPNAADFAASVRTYSNLSLGTIAKRLVQLAESWSGGGLPIVLPDDVAGTATRTYRGYDLGTIRHYLDLLTQVEGGPEITFDPRLTEDRLGVEWVMRVGDPLLTQPGDDWSWSLAPAQGPVAGVSLTRDAGAMVNEVFAADSGMDESRNIVRQDAGDAGVVDLRDVGFPLMQGVVERQGDAETGAISSSTLRSHARAELKANNRPYSEVSLAVRADQHPRLGAYKPGDWARVWGNEHELLSLLWPQTGYHRTRIAGFSGDLGNTVNVSLLPAREGR